MNVFLLTINNYACANTKSGSAKINKYVLFCLLIMLNGCSRVEHLPLVNFNIKYQDQLLKCGIEFDHLSKQWQLKQLQFFVSNIALKNKQGSWHSWLMQKNPHQSHNVALIGEQCSDIKNHFNEWTINLSEQLNLNDYTAIKFTLGVPFELNHLNPLTQPSPLNDSSMFWVWQTGHKFLRLELTNADENWLFHLGSTGCNAPSAVRAPKNECKYPNRVNVELDLPKEWQNTKSKENETRQQQSINSLDINIDLAKLLNGLALNANTFCQSSPDNESCKPLLSALGVKDKNNNSKMRKTNVFGIKINE